MDVTWADYGIAGLALGVLALAVTTVAQLARSRSAHGDGSSRVDPVLIGLLDRNTKALEGLQSTMAHQTEALTDIRVGMADLGATLREHGARLEEIRRNTDGRRRAGKG